MSSAKITWPRSAEPGLNTVPLDEEAAPVLIGRRRGAAVCIDDASVSRAHAELSVTQGVWMVQDIGSVAGTFLLRDNEPPRKLDGRRRLEHGDRIRVGRTILKFHDPPVPDDPGATERAAGDTIVLTSAEQKVLRLLCARELDGRGGWPTDGEVAADLVVAESTIRSHMKSLYRKFDLVDVPDRQKRARLVRRAIDEGLV